MSDEPTIEEMAAVTSALKVFVTSSKWRVSSDRDDLRRMIVAAQRVLDACRRNSHE